MAANTGPPWYRCHPDGSIHLSGIPERLKNHRALKERGISARLAGVFKPGVVFYTVPSEDYPCVVVKILDLATEELPIYERLLRHLDHPANHTIPCEIERSEHPLLIMPMLGSITTRLVPSCKSQSDLLRAFYSLVEGVDYLHRLHIAHMDLSPDNCLVGVRSTEAPTVVPGRVYIPDFNTSRQLELGPGEQHAITLPGSQIRPPNGLRHFDPYSWDMYCVGHVFAWMLKVYCEQTKCAPPLIAQWYTRWLIGSEQGCRAVCHCRPTAQVARLFLLLICRMGHLVDAQDTLFSSISRVQ